MPLGKTKTTRTQGRDDSRLNEPSARSTNPTRFDGRKNLGVKEVGGPGPLDTKSRIYKDNRRG